MSLIPLGNRVIIEPIEVKEKSSGGIIIPDVAKEKQQEGRVVAVGEGRCLDDGSVVALKVKIDDDVLYSKHACVPVKVDDVDMVILREDDILGIIQ